MGPESMDEFERELHQSLERVPASPGLKPRLLERRYVQHATRRRRILWWGRLAIAAALLFMLAGTWMWRSAERRREGEEARRQVIIALRITNRALQQMQSQLAAHNQNVLSHERNEQE